jgi:hypothetical protein
VAEPAPVNKPRKSARPLADLVGACFNEAFAKQGFATSEIVTHWDEIVGPDVAACSEPLKINWPRRHGDEPSEPATLVLRVEGPAALEIQHLAGVVIERVNRFFGWQAIGKLAFRQAPLARHNQPKRRPPIDEVAAKRIADSLTGVSDDKLRAALGRLGAAVRKG